MANGLGKIAGWTGYLYHSAAKVVRRGRWPLTMGVRVLVRDGPSSILLVRHTYAAGWHFPGGAVDRRETALDAAVRELREEALIEAIGPPRFVGLYLNLTQNRSDHIVFYEAEAWRRVEGKMRALEIAEAKFFPVHDLPQGTTGGTKRRLMELDHSIEQSLQW